MNIFNALAVTTLNENNPASIWNEATGTLVANYRGGGAVPRHCISISGGYVYTSQSGSPLIHRWPLNKQHPESRRLIAPGKIQCFDFSQDGTHAVVAVGEKVHLYQITSGSMVGTAAKHFQPLSVVKFNQRGTLIACGGQDGQVTVWTLANLIQSADPLFSSMDHNLPICDLCFTTGNLRSRIVSVSSDYSCKIFDLASGKQLLSIAFPSRPTCLTISPNEATIFLGNINGGIFEVNLLEKSRKTAEYHEPTSESGEKFVGHDKQVSCLTCTTDFGHLVSGSYDETIKIWHIESHQCVRTIPQKGVVTNVFFRVFSSFDFTTEFKPKSAAHSFVNPANRDVNDEGGFDIVISDDQLLEREFEMSCSTTALTNDEIRPTKSKKILSEEAKLKMQIEKLKNSNKSMYKFALKALTNGNSNNDGDSNNDANSETEAVKPKKKQVRKKNSSRERVRKKKPKTEAQKLTKKIREKRRRLQRLVDKRIWEVSEQNKVQDDVIVID